MKFYNACLYDKRYVVVPEMVIDVNEAGKITSVVQNPKYEPEPGDYNCRGNIVSPAFVDSAVTLPGRFIFSEFGLDISHYNSVDMYLNAIACYKNENGLRGFGFNSMVLAGKQELVKEELDKRYPDKRAYIYADDMTTVIVNQYILDELKDLINVDEDERETGELGLDDIFIMKEKTDILNFNSDEIASALLSFQYDMFSNGVTCVRVLDVVGGWDVIEAVNRLYDLGAWFLTVILCVPVYPFDEERDIWKRYNKYLGMSNQRLFVTGITATLDGSVDSMQAVLSRGYTAAEEWRGRLFWDVRKLRRIVQTFISKGIDVNLRAYGDGAVGEATMAFGSVTSSTGTGRKIITHAYLMSDYDIYLCNQKDIAVCVEPALVAYNEEFYDGDVTMLGDRCYDEYPVGRLAFSGVDVLAGSNTPTQRESSPLTGIYRATRRVAQNAVTPYKMFTAYTLSAYVRYGLYNQKGFVKPNYDADFVLLNKDIFRVRDSMFLDVECIATVACGKVVFGC